MSVLPVSQNKRRALYRNLMVGLIAILGVLAFVSRSFGVEVHQGASLILLPVVVLAALQFGALDEVAKHAHYAAWYWGCLAALVAIGALAVGLSNGVVPFEPIATQAAHWIGSGAEGGFVAGLLAAPILMLAGYLVFSTIHWLRTR